MIPLNEYKQNFQPLDVPEALASLLVYFNQRLSFFSSGFELTVDDKALFKTWSNKPEFLECIYPIGQANGSGSAYVIWRRNGMLQDAPIVVFGDEGGVHVVAGNVVELLRILTLDAEPMISHKSVTYYKSQDDKASDRAAEYAEWLAKQFTLQPVTGNAEVEKIVKYAQSLYGKEFGAWMDNFVAV